jgi:hypothetical protein
VLYSPAAVYDSCQAAAVKGTTVGLGG